jgi:hypothetical protein
VASFSAFGERLKHSFDKFRWPEKWPKPPPLSRAWKIALIWIGGIFATLIVIWIALNLALANPKIGTPFVNWSLRTFGAGSAHVEMAKLARPFSNRFDMQALDWPGTVEAKEITVTFDLFGWLPGHPWASKLRVRDGEVMLEDKDSDRKTINPQRLVDAIEVENLDLKFTRRNKLREVTIVKASGAFSTGTVTGEAVSGRNRITFENLRRDWDGGLHGAVTAKGENLKDLADILGASAPDTPPFNVNGELRMWERTWSVSNLAGRIGDSDIGGAVSIDLKPKKPFLVVDLKSDKLDFDDMGVVFGIPIGVGKGETTNDEQRDAKVAFDRSSRLIPDTHLDFSRLAAVNGDISFVAGKVVDAPMGISSMSLKSTLRDQVLDFSRARVNTSTGNLDAKVRIDARKDPARTRASGSLRNLPISRIWNTPFVRGSLNGVFVLNMTGSGFREAFGSATGDTGLWSTNSEVAHIATEAAGLDIGEVLLDLSRDNKGRDYLKSRCMIANIDVKDGQATLNPALIDNKDSLILVTGGANLKTEAIDLKVKAAPHDVSLGKLFGDIKITGTLRHPKVKALNEKTVLQAGLSVLLSTITGGLAALPFVEFGGEPDAPCRELLADSRSPSKKPTAPPTSKKAESQKQKS